VVNPTDAIHDLTPTIRGVRLRGGGRLHQIAPPGADATNRAGQEPAVTIVETALATLPATLHIPPVSVSLYALDVA